MMNQPPLDDTQKMRAVRVDTPPNMPQMHTPLGTDHLLDPNGDDGYDDAPRGVGCGMTMLLLGIVGVFGLIIVGLSATAGWTSGQRSASANATATTGAEHAHQAQLVANDISAGNYDRADIRLRYLATEAPNMGGIAQLMETGTALFLTRQPTATPTATETPAPTNTEAGPTTEPTLEPTATISDPYDLAGRLQRAQSSVAVAQWQDAIDDLDVILAVDPNYEVVTVRNLMLRALSAQALALFRSGESGLGEAIFLTDRAEEFGDIGELSFERYVASLYLSARSRVGTSDFTGAIRDLDEIRRVAPNYMNGGVNQLLFDNYVQYADALMYGQPCSAVQQYTNALQLFNNSTVAGKRSTAQNWCEFGTPTPPGFVATEPGMPSDGTVAPIGQP